MTIDIGEKIHIIERRYFPGDLRRHFVGEIVGASPPLIRVKGYAWVFNEIEGKFIRKAEIRERLICLGTRLTINIIPKDTDVAEIKYSDSPQAGLVVTDGNKFSLEITEFTDRR